MLRQFGPSTWVALVVGAALAVVLFVPVVAYRYRKAGRLRPIDLVTLVLVATYFVALWSYTLVPLPEDDTFRCVAAQLRPLQFIADIRADPHRFLRNRALLQVLLNVVLFLPLGFFLRILARRGAVVATLVGFAVSATIEFTQRTGIWGLYHCAYRVFDVDDIIVNTSGALLGSLLALPVAVLLDRRRPLPAVTRVTLGRRLVGMLADGMLIVGLGGSLIVGWRAFALYVLQWRLADLPTSVETVLGYGVPALLEAWWVLVRGRTLGEGVVQLQPTSPGTYVPLRRLAKYVTGVGGFVLLASDLVPVPLLFWVFLLASLVAAVATDDHRGLSHLAAGMRLRVEVVEPAGL